MKVYVSKNMSITCINCNYEIIVIEKLKISMDDSILSIYIQIHYVHLYHHSSKSENFDKMHVCKIKQIPNS